MFFSGVVSLRRLRAILALELTELRLCFYAKNKRRNFHSACSAALLYLSRAARGALFVGGPVLVPQFCGNLGDTILKLTVRIAAASPLAATAIRAARAFPGRRRNTPIVSLTLARARSSCRRRKEAARQSGQLPSLASRNAMILARSLAEARPP